METVHLAGFESPIGPLRILSTGGGVAYLELPHANGRGLAGWLSRHAPAAKTVEAFAPNRTAIAQVLEYLEGKRTRFTLPLDLRGTPFQRAVWEELLRIPYGETRSYQAIAQALGELGASRAVGGANGANPVALIVPCHRVVASHGLGGYGGGLALKRRLLALERNRFAAPKQGRLL
jgi:methylated-DNA-[protein]-cysteine S-methyltransferase